MPGNKIGGAKAAKTNKAKYGDNFYRDIALKAQQAWRENGKKPRGFAAMPKEKVAAAGRAGGARSKRVSKK